MLWTTMQFKVHVNYYNGTQFAATSILSSARTSSVNAVNYYVFKVHVNITMALNSLLHYLLVRISSVNDVNYCVLTLAACLLLTAIVKCVMKLWRTRSVLRGAHQAWPSWWWLARVIAWALCNVRDRGIVQGRGMYLHWVYEWGVKACRVDIVCYWVTGRL